MKLYHRKLFPFSYNNEVPFHTAAIDTPTTTHQNTTTSTPSPPPWLEEQYSSHVLPFDSSMALTILVLLTALFFMGFFSIYLRRFSNDPSTEFSSRRGRDSQTTRHPPRVGTGRKGLDPEVVKSLPVYNYYRGDAKYKTEECPICLGEFEEKDRIKLIPYCGHVFHLECIDTWLGMHVTCPVCRGTQFLASGQVDENDRSTIEICMGMGVRSSSRAAVVQAY